MRTLFANSSTYPTPEPSKSLLIGLPSPSLHVAHVVFHTPVERGQADGDFIGFGGIWVKTKKVKNFQFLFFFFFALLIFFRTGCTSGSNFHKSINSLSTEYLSTFFCIIKLIQNLWSFSLSAKACCVGSLCFLLYSIKRQQISTLNLSKRLNFGILTTLSLLSS